jgi:hypothetical protein
MLAGARTLVAVPMLKENELIGAIVIYRQQAQPFTEKRSIGNKFRGASRHRHREHTVAQRAAQSPRQQTATSRFWEFRRPAVEAGVRGH